MTSHHHDPSAATQNVGNVIGTRSSVRQSRLYRRHESGNTMKGVLGLGTRTWEIDRKEGAYSGAVYDHNGIAGCDRKTDVPALTSPSKRSQPVAEAPAVNRLRPNAAFQSGTVEQTVEQRRAVAMITRPW